jgi:hypothetical protein
MYRQNLIFPDETTYSFSIDEVTSLLARAQRNLANLDESCLADGCDRAEFAEDFGRNFLVHVDDADGFVGILHAS